MIDFVDTTLSEKKMVLNWRNDESIKKWMYNKQDISINNHLKYIETLENLNTKQYCIVRKDDNYIGVVYFTNIDFEIRTTDFGLYANPFEKVAGVGRILEEVCIKYAFDILNLKTLKLEVFCDNEKAINLYKKFKFKESGKKMIDNKEVICMELINE